MRFEEAYERWTTKRLTQEEAAQLLGECARTFRRYIDRYEEAGLDGLRDKRLHQLSHRRAPADKVARCVEQYQQRHDGWDVKHYYRWYRRDGGTRSYSWVKQRLQDAGAVAKRGRRASAVNRCRYHYRGARITVARRLDGVLSIFHGPRRLARYTPQGEWLAHDLPTAA